EHTWAEYYARARAFGLGLVALGLEAGDRVAIQSEDRPEWLFSEIGAICVGATSLGVYSTSPPAEVEYLLAHSGARFIVAEDQEQVDKALCVADKCPALERIIYIDPKGLRGYRDRRLLAYEEVERLGRGADPERARRVSELRGERRDGHAEPARGEANDLPGRAADLGEDRCGRGDPRARRRSAQTALLPHVAGGRPASRRRVDPEPRAVSLPL